MGAGQSLEQRAQECKYNKQEVGNLIQFLSNAQEVMQFYASSALIPKSPNSLPKYPIYEAEAYFNNNRMEVLVDLESLNIAGLSSVYDAYNFVRNFQNNYEKSSDDDTRKEKLSNILEVTKTVIRFIIADLAKCV